MKRFILVLFFLMGCSGFDDVMNNQYLEKAVFADPKAEYVGEWTGGTPLTLTSIKINQDGHAILCSSNQHVATGYGKIFKDGEKIKIIFDSGSQFEITSNAPEYLILKGYGQKTKYYSDNVPKNCMALFKAEAGSEGIKQP